MLIVSDIEESATSGTRTYIEKAIELGPYSKRLSLKITGRSHHKSTGDDSWATQTLYYDNAAVASHNDPKDFDDSYLETKYSLYLEAGSVAQFRIVTDDHEADEKSYSIQVDWRTQN